MATTLEFGRDRSEVAFLEHPGGAGGLESIGADRVPSTEDEVAEVGQRYELADLRIAVLVAFAEADVCELAERADGNGVPGPGGEHTGDEGGGDGAHAGGENPEAAGGRSDGNWFGHGGQAR
jgi:hypothetical protein